MNHAKTFRFKVHQPIGDSEAGVCTRRLFPADLLRSTVHHNPEELFAGSGEMAALMRAKDWSSTALGPASAWPQSLRTAISICLQSRFPMFIWWGRELTILYNDGYRLILGAKHPAALGAPGRVVWPEIWDVIGPMLDGVLYEGRSTWSENQLLFLHRHGYDEETYFTFSYSPILDESGGIGGVFTAVYETTEQVLAARRLVTLRDLAARAAEATTTEQACASTMAVLAQNSADVPFAHLILRTGDELKLASTTCAALPVITSDIASQVTDAASGGVALVHAATLGALTDGLDAEEAVILPLSPRAVSEPQGYLVAGVSRKRAFNPEYRSFFELVAGHVVTAIANAEAREAEQRRLDALAELDRAKTAFFSNVSHEFRTPLTLMLGPLEDMLEESDAAGAITHEQLALVHRQGLRLLKLVNTLLDFSRLEAGRTRAHYVQTDVGAMTSELASMFRTVTERAGLKLVVDCEPIAAPVFVDRDMWEKIVLNLLSNALKFTLQGQITARVRRVGNSVELSVADTGSGIPAAQLPLLFTRFHRVEGTRRRTHEGTGIGLALVQELAQLHGGGARVESVEGEGSTFTVSIPLGAEHLPQEQVDRTGSSAPGPSSAPRLFVEEAMQWLTGDEPRPEAQIADAAGKAKACILLVDDNGDLRNYVRRLLEPQYSVISVADGAEALEIAVVMKPDLVLADVMMPNMDGFALLDALRHRPSTAAIPVILLSARAGEEARAEGLAAGADEYLVKPFSARELQARISSILALSKVRRDANAAIRESEERYRSLIEASAAIVWRRSSSGEQLQQPGWEAFTGQSGDELRDAGTIAAVHPDDRAATTEAWRRAVESGSKFEIEHRLRRRDGEYRNMLVRAVPIRDAEGQIREWIGVHTDVTSERRLQETLEGERLMLRDVFTRAPAFVATLRGPDHIFELANPMYMQLVGSDREIIGKSVRQAFPDLEGQGFFELLDSVYRSGEPFVGNEIRVALRRSNGREEERFLDLLYQPMRSADGRVDGIFVHGVDVTEKVRARTQVEQQAAELERVNRAKDDFLATLSHELRTPLTAILGWSHMLRIGLNDEETTRLAIDTIDRSAQIQAQLIDDVLDLSRIVTGKLRINPTVVDVADVASKALDGVRLAATAREVLLEADFQTGPELALALGDAGRLQQVIWNLLTNAIKFTPPGGRISLSVKRRGQTIRIIVTDTGIGITPDFLPYVFEPFRQAERTTTRVHGGLGLGLAIVRHMVHMHGGSISAQSEGEGRGATFTIELPAARSVGVTDDLAGAALHDSDVVDRNFADLRGTSVLVIDDDDAVSEVLATILRHCGAMVETASSVPKAIQTMEKGNPDVVVCDIAMPNEDGFDFARWLAANPRTKQVPLLAVTAFGRPEDERRTLAAGFTGYIRKPVDPANLSRTIAGLARRPTAD